MNHIDEHTLELYVLRAGEIRSRIDEIEAHLLECQGCRSLVNEMEIFHSQLHGELQNREGKQPVGRSGVVRSRSAHEPAASLPELFAPLRPSVPIGRVHSFVRRHPLVVAGGSLGFAMFLGIFATFMTMKSSRESSITDRVPASHTFDIASNSLQILNKEEQILWDARVDDAREEMDLERGRGISRVVIGDDAEGGNEIITTLPLARYPDHEGQHLRIFGANKELLKDIHLTANVPYRGRENFYSPYFNLDWILLLKSPERNQEEIIVAGNNVGRSPSIIFRLNSAAEMTGEYFHFGNLMGIYFKDLNGDGKEELIAVGRNDVDDSTHEEFPVIAVLDPEKITGETKATACGKYLLSASAAEIYYIRLPWSDIDSASYQRPEVAYLEESDEHTLQFASEGISNNGERFAFHFQFDHSMNIARVLTNDHVDALHRKLVDDHKLSGSIDRAYLENLKDGVRYWNGKTWVNEVTRVVPQ